MKSLYSHILSPSQQIAVRSGLLAECVFHGEVYRPSAVPASDFADLDVKGFEEIFESTASMREAVNRSVASAPIECAACRDRILASALHDDFEDDRVHVA